MVNKAFENEDREFRVGQEIHIKLSGGRIEPATIKAIIETTAGKKLQVDFGSTI